MATIRMVSCIHGTHEPQPHPPGAAAHHSSTPCAFDRPPLTLPFLSLSPLSLYRYDTICVKEYWHSLLDAAKAHRPLQLAKWDGSTAINTGPGVEYGSANLVCKISDSYLGIGDKVLKRGKSKGGDFDTLEDVQRILDADPEYVDRSAILCEFCVPDSEVKLSSDGYGQVHSLDIVTIRTREGVRVLTCLLWTDCDSWTSHSCQAGYLVDVHSETVVAPTAWYSPHFATMPCPLLGTRLPGVREACRQAIAAHEQSTLPWLTSVGWDAMLTPDGTRVIGA